MDVFIRCRTGSGPRRFSCYKIFFAPHHHDGLNADPASDDDPGHQALARRLGGNRVFGCHACSWWAALR